MFCLKTSTRKIAVPHFLPPDCTELRMLLSCALHSWQYIHESQSCWHPVCKSFRRNFSTESHWDVTLNTQLLFGSHAAAFMQRLGISSNTWEPNHQLRHNCKPGLQFTAGLCAGLQVSTCKNTKTFSHELPMEVCLSQQLHSLDRNSCASTTNHPCPQITQMNTDLNKKQSWVKANTLTHNLVEARS